MSGDVQPIEERSRLNILALSGGGYRGLFTATLLAHFEQKYDTKISDHFDLIVGTSAGALIASALAAKIPASEIVKKFKLAGPAIFPKKYLLSSLKRLIFKAPYTMLPLEQLIIELLGEAVANGSINESELPLAVTAVSYTRDEPRIFAGREYTAQTASSISVKDAILASASAPTFFPSRNVNGEALIDGGLVANAPELVALTLGLEHSGTPLSNIYMLGIGTSSPKEGELIGRQRYSGILGWILTKRNLIKVTLSTQEKLAIRQAKAILGKRYQRLDTKHLTSKQVKLLKEMDNTSIDTENTLIELAALCWDAIVQDTENNKSHIEQFFCR